MTDRELLEAAAKAGGLMWDKSDGRHRGLWIVSEGRRWNALADDGDALRLAVKLRLNLEFFSQGVHVMALDAQPYSDDPAAATRRAIVRAAASIGSSGEREGDR